MPKYAVIIRQSQNNRPIISGIIKESDDPEIDNMDHYLYSTADDRIQRFKQDFVEFRKATWYVDLIHDHSNVPYDSKTIEPEK